MSEKSLSIDATLHDVVKAIESSRRRIAVVVDGADRLLGTLTDGDVRRCLLAGGTLDTRVDEVMNKNPVTAEVGSTDTYVLDLMKQANILSVPLVDEIGRFVRIEHVSDLGDDSKVELGHGFKTAVIMAGGEGSRLRPLTESLPKPMIDIGGIPLLERQMRRLVNAGIERCFISVNYLGHIIENHFKDGSDFGISIDYLREDAKLGTAGALSLLPKDLSSPIVVMNGDVLTTSNLGSLYTYHMRYRAVLTVAAMDHKIDIPYGVIRSEGVNVVGLEEKPSQRFLCNAGIYAIATEALDIIPAATFYNMTDLIRDCIVGTKPITVFPLHEYWSDIGTLDDLEKARAVFKKYEEKV